MNITRSTLIVSSLLALSAAALAQMPPTNERDGMSPPNSMGGHRGERGMRQLDTNKDGKLSREEAAKQPRLAQNFDAMDANKDGFLTPEEGRAFAKANHPDTNRDGSISREEAAQHPRLAQNFDQLDTNKDGMLSKAELKAHRDAHGKGHGRHKG